MPTLKTSHHCLALLAAQLFAGCVAAATLTDVSLEPAIPTVLTPVRLKQPRTEVPASVTVIDRQLIEASGIRQLAELFRLVPGTAVGARDGWNYVVSYHGTNYRDSRRMQVLVDGRSVYQAGLATIDWNDIPVALEDIERIEIVRGPDTAAYGANAFLGVISITTRHPDDSPRLRLKASNGSGHTEDYYGSTSGKVGDASYRVTANGRRDAGFDVNRYGTNRRDSTNLQLFNTRWEVSPRDNWNLDIEAGYKSGEYTDDNSPLNQSPKNYDVRDWFLSTTSEHFLSPRNSLKWQLDLAGQHETSAWRTCIPSADIGIPPALLPSGNVVCGNINENGTNQRTDFDLQDTVIGVAPWKLVAGMHAQHQRAISQTYYNGSVERTTYQLFGNFEYHFLPHWLATVAGSQEYAATIGQNFSPRVALLFLPSDDHSFRAVYSEAIRTPDLFEVKADWSYTATDVATANGEPISFLGSTVAVPLHAVAPGNLHEEKIRSRELGYYGLWLNRRLQTDLKWFWDDLTNLTGSSLTIDYFNPQNNGAVKQQGFETEIDYHATDWLRLRATYAVIHSATDPNDIYRYREISLTPEHSGSATMILTLPDRWEFSTNYYFANPINELKFSRLDTRLAKTLHIVEGDLRIAATIRHEFSREGNLFMDNRYNSPNRLLFTADLIF